MNDLEHEHTGLNPQCAVLVAEAPVCFVLPLLNQSAVEEDTVTLACRLSKPDQHVTWFREDVAIAHADRKYEMRSEACNYTLTIPRACVEDTGMYRVQVGQLESAATVIVYGENRRIAQANVWKVQLSFFARKMHEFHESNSMIVLGETCRIARSKIDRTYGCDTWCQMSFSKMWSCGEGLRCDLPQRLQ